MTRKEEEQLFDKGVTAIRRLTKQHGHIEMAIAFADAMTIAAGLQLAMRHSGLSAGMRQELERLVRLIQSSVRSEPALNRIIELGFDPTCDVNKKRKK